MKTFRLMKRSYPPDQIMQIDTYDLKPGDRIFVDGVEFIVQTFATSKATTWEYGVKCLMACKTEGALITHNPKLYEIPRT